MLYNLLKNKNYMLTAGKVTIATAISGVLIFAFIFLFNAGKTELMKVEAQQTASTTLTVLNTPPDWILFGIEQVESSTSTPTNSGSLVRWTAVANDPNGANYFLLICSTNATPTAVNSSAPFCTSGTQWGVSTATISNTPAFVSTTTLEAAPFAQGANNWYAWICDNDAVSARCNATSSQGINATNSSPFNVNYRPTFTSFTDDSPKDPGQLVTFSSVSSDSDGNSLKLVVCSTATYSTSTNDCGSSTIATTTGTPTSNATALYTFPDVIRDQNYAAYGYLIDQYNHTAIGATQGSNSVLTVSNVAPTVASSSIVINGGSPMVIITQAGQTNGMLLAFETTDANSCRNSADGFEITNYVASVYHATSTNTCGANTAGDYDPNDCYTHAVATTTWNISCTASTTSCASAASSTDPTMNWTCTFPLWYVTNPTDAGNFAADEWRASVGGVDDNNATGTATVSSSGVNVNSAAYMALQTAQIVFGQLEPGQKNETLTATTTIQSVGNTGIDQNFLGESMCKTFTAFVDCPTSASSTIPDTEQRFATSSVTYASGYTLSSSTPQFLDMNIAKPTSTSTPTSGIAYWGINVPGTITLAGNYTGLNTFQVVASY